MTDIRTVLKQENEDLTETIDRQALMIYAKDRQIAELTRMLFALGKQDGQTIRTLKQELDTLKSCKHMNVKIHSRLYRPSTREEPAEYEYKAECKDCGELFSADDVDEWAEVEE